QEQDTSLGTGSDLMSVKVDVDVKKIQPKINKATAKAQYVYASQVHADMNRYVPFLSGDLRSQSTIAVDGKSIYYNVPYARAKYYGYVGKGSYKVRHYTTTRTTARCDIKAKIIHGRSWARVAGRAMKLK